MGNKGSSKKKKKAAQDAIDIDARFSQYEDADTKETKKLGIDDFDIVKVRHNGARAYHLLSAPPPSSPSHPPPPPPPPQTIAARISRATNSYIASCTTHNAPLPLNYSIFPTLRHTRSRSSARGVSGK